MKKLKRRLLIAILLLLFILYLGVWFLKLFNLSEVASSSEDSKKLKDCIEMAESIGEKFELPFAQRDTHRKAVYCNLEINFLFRKYSRMILYGVTNVDIQKSIVTYIKNHSGPAKPIKLIIYEKEVWNHLGDNAYKRGKEKIVFTRWLE